MNINYTLDSMNILVTGGTAAANFTVASYRMINDIDGWEDDYKDAAEGVVETVLMSKGLPYYGPRSIIKGLSNYVELDQSSGSSNYSEY